MEARFIELLGIASAKKSAEIPQAKTLAPTIGWNVRVNREREETPKQKHSLLPEKRACTYL